MIRARPPIRIVTRLLAELQTSIIARGLPLVGGDLERLTILALIVRQTGGDDQGGRRGMSTKSIADSLTRPYESVRRQAGWLIAAGLCERGPHGLGIARTPLATVRMGAVRAHAHDAFVRFVEDLGALGLTLPAARPGQPYRPASGVEAAIDIILAVIDGNRGAHRDWTELAVFSTILGINVGGFARDPVRAMAVADETAPTPASWWRPVATLAVARALGLAETSARRHVNALIRGGQVIRGRGGLIVSEAWMNEPDNVAVSQASFANVHRILHHLAARGFRFDAVASAYLDGRPPDISASLDRPRGGSAAAGTDTRAGP